MTGLTSVAAARLPTELARKACLPRLRAVLGKLVSPKTQHFEREVILQKGSLF